ncbi:DUF5695 domain-containing protein [Leeuwenhoekiella palythoae]|uniref:DUF5695 domain-containing protein n=1 Tax=Leeuwenhoekiella palythoae TaxID=573501 RepID=UPI001CE1679A|nr:DUF5695 domain-containing protein [Leeuwenhoekiella palythoae]UBZ09792.1 DUF5695 domain-containing protein [Leeuwenhoekiella palythoae]
MNTYKNALRFFVLLFMGIAAGVQAQEYWDKVKEREATFGLESGFETLETDQFILKLVKASQTVASLAPKSDPEFDFTPGDRLEIRAGNGLYHLGDINFRYRLEGSNEWNTVSTATARKPVEAIAKEGALAAANLANTLPEELPLSITRYYAEADGDLILAFDFQNKTDQPIELGALGIPMIFNNILEGNSLEEAHAKNVFFDPYIGLDAGYLEVKRLDGKGKTLLVLPENNMPFEAYRPLLDDPSPRSIVFEGFHEWMATSKAYALEEWEGVEQWNTPTSSFLKPGELKTFSIRLTLAPEIKKVQQQLTEKDMPVAVGVPGYVLPQDVQGKLFLKYNSDVSSIKVTPEGALSVEKDAAKNTYDVYTVTGNQWGRARVEIKYTNGKTQSINYKVIKPESELVADFGNFLFDKQWFDDDEDPFNRAPSLISYDYQNKRQVTQDGRVWIAGLSDEGGAGSWLGGMMKQYLQPDQEQVSKLEDFVNQTVWGVLQNAEGEHKYGVRKSVLYYEPEEFPAGTYNDTINWNTWAAWNKEGAADPGRSYNYPHVVAAYWTLYRLSRYHDNLVTQKDWKWYLEQAYQTTLAMTTQAPYYAQFGQMEGSIFLHVLEDLKREQLTEEATKLEAEMKKRADHWESLAYPFGSEMPWDSTGQEEVYMWSDYFGYDAKAAVTLSAILAYMPTMPHWAYNGNARRYWDFLYGGKLSRVERQIHHYGSGLNAIPVLDNYRENPEDLHLLKVGYGGLLGAVSNITEDGFGAAAFHSWPSTLEIDYLSGDYGSNFYGYAINSSAYLVEDAELGYLAFGGNLTEEKNSITMQLTTAAKNAVFVQPLALWITLDAGAVQQITFDKKTKEVQLTLAPKTEITPFAYINLPEEYTLDYEKVRGAYKIPLQAKPITLTLKH